jgi:biotin carboxyl carrier protein
MSTQAEQIPAAAPKHRMSLRNRILFWVTAWLIVLMPILFFWSTWFGRPLSDAEITQYLRDDAHPRHIQHALVQIGDRMARARNTAGAGTPANSPANFTSITQWYPELVRLATHPVEEIRNTDAWLMGQDPRRLEFHQALLKMLDDPSSNVRSNAALSLVSFGDSAGHDQIVAMLKPSMVKSQVAGQVTAIAKAGDTIRSGTMLARLQTTGISSGGEIKLSVDVRSPITGKVRAINVKKDDQVTPGAELAVVDPGPEQVWEALRALYLIGTKDDLPLVRPYEQPSPEMNDRIREQARLTDKEIVRRGS